MLPSCVNSEQAHKVVYFSEMKDEDFLRKLLEDFNQAVAKLPEAISDGLSGSKPLNDPPKGVLGLQPWLATAGAIILILAGLWGVVKYVLHAELSDPSTTINTNLQNIQTTLNSLRDKDVGGLQKDVDHMTKDLGRLQDWQAKVVFSAPSTKASSQLNNPTDIKNLAVRARAQKVSADIGTIQTVAEPLERSTDQDSWGALLELANLRSFVNSSFVEAKQNINETIGPGNGSKLIPMVRSNTQWIELKGMRVTLGGTEADYGVIFDSDGHTVSRVIRNVIFKDCKVTYEGRPVVLINVFFDDCTFDIEQNANGERLLMAILNPQHLIQFSAD